MTTPARIQLSRKKGFRMQAASLALNGLPAVKCARPGRLGNPFDWQFFVAIGGTPAAAKRHASHLYKRLIEERKIPRVWEAAVHRYYRGKPAPTIDEIAQRLDGKNGACFCSAGDRCHVDLQLAWAKAWKK